MTLDRAEALARSINNPDRQAQALAVLARAAAGAGDLDRAEALARSITSPDRQAQALVDLAREAEPEQARSLLALALTAVTWQSLMEALVRADPGAVIALASEYLTPAS